MILADDNSSGASFASQETGEKINGRPGARPDDSTLMSRVIQRDAIAFERLYDRFSPPMFSLVLRIVQCRAEAEDVLQEVFWAVWVRAADYQPHLGSPFAWIAMITRHKAIDRLRARLCREKHLDAEADWRADGEGGENGATPLIATETGREVRTALATLDAGERRALELAFFHGLTHVEFAVASGIPVGTIKARIRRGMFKLRAKLEPSCEIPA